MTKSYRRYEFRTSSYNNAILVDIVDSRNHYKKETEYLTEKTYDRFVKVANSKQFSTEILDSDYGVAWAMWRMGDG